MRLKKEWVACFYLSQQKQAGKYEALGNLLRCPLRFLKRRFGKMKWQNKLTKKELKHLKDVFDPGVRVTLFNIKEMFSIQAKMRKFDSTHYYEPCWICRTIAKKLGCEV